jgi:8-oxo-dGTP diphosphatase
MLRQRRLVVVAAVIQKDGQILIGQRRRGDSHEFKWEFPGGKVEEGEQPRDALQRELEEELCIQAHVGPELVRYEYHYPRRNPILLIFHKIQDFKGEPISSAFEQIRWESPQRLLDYDFLDGDVDFIRRLASGDF